MVENISVNYEKNDLKYRYGPVSLEYESRGTVPYL